MSDNVVDLSLREYNVITEEISRLPFWLQILIEDVVTVRCGPLRDITTRVNIANFNWFMNQIKMVTTSDYLHKLFCSPSVMGKCAALYSILELHGQLWKSTNLAMLEELIPTLYSIVAWIFEKAQNFGEKLTNGFYWVKAKFRCGPGEKDSYPGLASDLPNEQDEAQPVTEESAQQHHINEILKFNDFYNIYVLGKPVAQDISYNNNCIFEAAGKAWNYDAKDLRKKVYDLVCKDMKKTVNKLEVNGIDKELSTQQLTELATSIEKGETIGIEAIPYICDILKQNVAAMFVDKEQSVSYIIDVSSEFDTGFKIIFNDVVKGANHWIHCEPKSLDKYGVVSVGAVVLEKKLKFDHDKSATVEEVVSEVTKETPATQEEVETIVGDLESTEMGKGFLGWLKQMSVDVISFFKNFPIIGGAVAFGYSIASAIGLSVGTFSNKLDKRCFWQKVSSCSKDFYFLSRGKDAMAKVFGDFGCILRDMMGIDDSPATTKFKNDLVDMTEKAEEMNAICQANPESIVNDPNKFVEFKKAMEAVRKQYKDLISVDPTINHSVLIPLWNRLNHAYQLLLTHYNKIVNNNEVRQRPFCLWLWGKTAIGKSELISNIIYRYNEATGHVWKSYTVSKGPEYLNGFAQEKVIIIDDFDSFTSVEGCLDALLIMNMVTCAAYNPNIAQLEDKAMQAKPALIIVCANFPTVKLNCGVNDFAAFERRRDMLVNVRWEAHEACSPSAVCEHVREVRQNLIATEKKSFDHLTFIRQDPLVIAHDNYRGVKNAYPKNALKVPVVDSKGFEIGPIKIEDIIAEMVETIAFYQKSYEITRRTMDEQRERLSQNALDKAKKAGLADPQSTKDNVGQIKWWVSTPNLALTGPPGSGKSFAMSVAMSRLTAGSYRIVKSLVEFDTGAATNWYYGDGVTHVFFEDTSNYVTSQHLIKWMDTWKERHDNYKDGVPVWVAAINVDVLKSKLTSEETYGVFIRRSTEFEFRFLQKKVFRYIPTLTYYTAKDLAVKPVDVAHSDYVNIVNIRTDDKVLQDTVATIIAKHKPDPGILECQVDLPVVHELVVDAVAYVDLNTKDFCNLINSKGTSAQAIGAMIGGRFVSEKFDRIDVGKRIWNTFTHLTSSISATFADMDEFVLTGANGNFFDQFNDGNFVMKFLDRAYCLFPSGGRIMAAIYDPLDAKVDMQNLRNAVVKSIDTFDFLSVTRSKLPPWFVVSTLIAEQVIKILAGGAVIAHSVQFNNTAFRAMNVEADVKKTTEKYLDNEMTNINSRLESKMYEKESGPIALPKPSIPKAIITETWEDKVQNKAPRVRALKKYKNVAFKRESADGYDLKTDIRTVSPEAFPNIVHTALEEAVENSSGEDKVALAQTSTDPQFYDSMKLAVKNMVDIRALNGTHIVYGLMLHGKLGTTVAHAFADRKVEQVLVHDIKGNKFTIKEKRRDASLDIFDFELTNSNVQFPDIRNHLATESLKSYNNRLGCLVNVDFLSSTFPIVTMRFYRLRESGPVTYTNNVRVNEAVAYVGGISGFISELAPQTKAGDCGSVMFLCDSSNAQKIVGLHVASSEKEGFFRCLKSIDYRTNVVQQSVPSKFVGCLEEFVPSRYENDLEGNRIIARCYYKPHLPTKSKLYVSPFAYGHCEYEPSILHPGDNRWKCDSNMIVEEAKKWLVTPKVHFEDFQKIKIRERMFEVGDWLGQKINSFGVRTSILTKTTALNAIRGYEHSQPIPTGTSAGYPYASICNNGKRELIRALDDGSRRFITGDKRVQALHNSIDRVIYHAKSGMPSDCAFVVFGKDELLKPGKNTRTIAAAPLQLVIPLRMYFHTINAALAEVWNVIPIKVGISPSSLDWHNLACYLLNVSDMGFSIDQKGFDFNVPKEVGCAVIEALIAIAQVTNPNLTVEDIDIMRGLHLNVSMFNIIINGLVYQSKTGIASGHPGTATENSIISFFFLYDAFCALAPVWYSKTVEHFVECVAAAIYGDDAGATVDPACLEFYNQVTVTKYLTETYGLVITNADKTSIIRPYYPLGEMQFISRGFKLWDGYYVGPLEMKRLIKPLNFCNGRKSHHWYMEPTKITDDLEIASAAARSALDEMFFHGKKAYENLRRHILSVVPSLGVVEVYYPPWHVKYESFFSLSSNTEQGLQVTTINVDRSIMNDLQAEKSWIKYLNRRCIHFGPRYYWDEVSKKRCEARTIPLYLQYLLKKVNEAFGTSFNEILANFYEPGGAIPYHKDNESMLDLSEGVACLTIIGDGVIEWKDKSNVTITKLNLCPNFCYYMTGEYVKEYSHSRHSHEKYTMSLTFRKIITSQ
nr:MAG: RNA-dependent RNA polymerase [Riboviria sp.]